MKKFGIIVLLYGSFMGIAPLAWPDHGDTSLAAAVDLAVHIACTYLLLALFVEWIIKLAKEALNE